MFDDSHWHIDAAAGRPPHHETVRQWWNRFGPMFAGGIRRRRISDNTSSCAAKRRGNRTSVSDWKSSALPFWKATTDLGSREGEQGANVMIVGDMQGSDVLFSRGFRLGQIGTAPGEA